MSMLITRLCGLALLIFGLMPNQAEASSCPARGGEPNVTVNATLSQVRYDYNRSINELRAMGTGDTHAINSAHTPLGLTSSQIENRYQMLAKITRLPDGTLCASLDKLQINMSFAEHTVYIARELPRGGCIAAEVERHENKHVVVNNNVLSEYRNKMYYAIRNDLLSLHPIRVYNVNEVNDALAARVKPIVQAAFQQMQDDRERRQDRIDSPAEYDRVSRSCNGEAQRYVRQAQR